MNRRPVVLAVLAAALAALGGSNAWSFDPTGMGFGTGAWTAPKQVPQGAAVPADPAEVDLEIADALKGALADILDAKSKDPCRADEELRLSNGVLQCLFYAAGFGGAERWSIEARLFKDTYFTLITVGAGRSYLLYNPRINGSTDLGGLMANRAVVNPRTLRAANDKAGLSQGRKAIEELKKQLRPMGAFDGGGHRWPR